MESSSIIIILFGINKQTISLKIAIIQLIIINLLDGSYNVTPKKN